MARKINKDNKAIELQTWDSAPELGRGFWSG
jgi:hypothetical protein